MTIGKGKYIVISTWRATGIPGVIYEPSSKTPFCFPKLVKIFSMGEMN